MNRRGFFKAIGTAVLGMHLALRLPPKPMEATFGQDLTPELLEETMDFYLRPVAQAMMRDMDDRMMAAWHRG